MHASRPGILCFDGAINRRKAAVKRIESQVRPFCPAVFSTLHFSASFPLFSFLGTVNRFSLPLASSFLSQQMSLRGPPRLRDCHCHRPAHSLVPHVPDLPHIITSLTSRLSDDRSTVTCFAVGSSTSCALPRD